jgi:hypothetical protein
MAEFSFGLSLSESPTWVCHTAGVCRRSTGTWRAGQVPAASVSDSTPTGMESTATTAPTPTMMRLSVTAMPNTATRIIRQLRHTPARRAMGHRPKIGTDVPRRRVSTVDRFYREGVALCHLPQQQWGLPPQGQQQCESRSGETTGIPSLGGLYSKISGFARRLRTRKSPISTVRRRSASCRTRSTRRCLPLMAL